MTNAQAMEIMQAGVIVVLKLAGPILILSMVVGILISIIQAATQIHEQTITFVPKLIIIGIICLATGNWMLEVLQEFTREVFTMML